jgi:hypothetical protein
MKLTINDKELEFKFKYSQLMKLLKETKKEITDLEDIVQDIQYSVLILSIGVNISIDEATELLDSGNFNDVTNISKLFAESVVQYISPNLPSQTN